MEEENKEGKRDCPCHLYGVGRHPTPNAKGMVMAKAITSRTRGLQETNGESGRRGRTRERN